MRTWRQSGDKYSPAESYLIGEGCRIADSCFGEVLIGEADGLQHGAGAGAILALRDQVYTECLL